MISLPDQDTEEARKLAQAEVFRLEKLVASLGKKLISPASIQQRMMIINWVGELNSSIHLLKLVATGHRRVQKPYFLKRGLRSGADF